ncbi:hypothetical protein MMC21_006274 [Puttea exsequens]|nr:hypothetical protein [Puttea exsequens]
MALKMTQVIDNLEINSRLSDNLSPDLIANYSTRASLLARSLTGPPFTKQVTDKQFQAHTFSIMVGAVDNNERWTCCIQKPVLMCVDENLDQLKGDMKRILRMQTLPTKVYAMYHYDGGEVLPSTSFENQDGDLRALLRLLKERAGKDIIRVFFDEDGDDVALRGEHSSRVQ